MIDYLIPLVVMTLFALTLSFAAASVLAVLTWFSPQVRWILPTLAGIAGAWYLWEGIQPEDYHLWQLCVGGCVLVWIAHGYGPTREAPRSTIWFGAILKAATILLVCLMSEVFVNMHHK